MRTLADSYSVKAKLSAVDSGFSSTLRGAMGALDGFRSKLSGISFGMLTGIGQSIFNGITNGIGDMVGEINSASAAWQTFEGNLLMLDWDDSDIADARKDLQEFAQQTVYSSSDMAQTFAQLAAVGVKDTDQLVMAFGGLAAAAENPQQAMKTLSQQATQMAAKPTVAWADFKLMMEQTPAGIAAVADEMGMTMPQLVRAVQAGTVSTNAFFDAVVRAGGAGSELSELARTPKTIGQAFDGLKETIANKLLPAFGVLSDIGIKAIGGISDALNNLPFDGEDIKEALVGWIEDAKPYWESFKNAAVKVWAVVSGVAQKLAPVFSAIKNAMGGAIKSVLDRIGQIDADAIVEKIGSGIEKVKPYWEAIKSVISSVAGVIAKVLPYIQKVGAAIGNFFLDNSETIAKFIPYIAGAIGAFKGFNLVKSIFGKASSGVGGAVSSIGGGISKVLDTVGTMIKNAGTGISTAFKGIGEGIKSVLSGLVPVIEAIGTAAQGIGKGVQSAFIGIGTALKLAKPTNILAVGAAIAIVAAGFTLLATQGDGVKAILEGFGSIITSICPVIESVGAVLNGIISTAIKAVAEALVILAPVMPTIASALVMLTPLITAFGEAFSMVAVAIGEAISKIVVAIGEGVALIVESLTPIVEIISNTITSIVQILVDGVVRLTEAIAPIVPVFVEAFTKITEIVSNAIVSIIEILAPYIPEITRMVEATSTAIQSICTAFTTLIEQISPVIDSVTQLVQQLGDSLTEILGGASELVAAFGDSISQVIESIGSAISGVIDSVAGVFDSMGEAAMNAGLGFEHLANGIKTITSLNLIDMAASMTAVALSLGDLVRKSEGIAEAGSGMNSLVMGLQGVANNGNIAALAFANLSVAVPRFASASTNATSAITTFGQNLSDFGSDAKKAGAAAVSLSAGLMSSVAGLRNASSATRDLSKNASNVERSIVGMGKAVAGMGKELNGLGKVAQTSMKALTSAFKTAARDANSSAKSLANSFTTSLRSGLAKAPTAARSAASSVASALRSGYSSAYSAGAYISIGFANGMRSQLAYVRSAASQMAAAADAAVRAKARIASPSKVSTALGEYWGEGFANGISDMARDVWNAAAKLVAIPNVATPDLALAYGGELSADYDYNRNATYRFDVSVPVDGREVARATVVYTQDELDRRQIREERKHGRV